MKTKKLLTACAVTAALATTQAFADAPPSPQLNWADHKGLSFVEILTEATVSYSQLYKRVDSVEVPVSWVAGWSNQDNKALFWEVFLNDELVKSGRGASGSTIISITEGGQQNIEVRNCNNDGCSEVSSTIFVVADTDGSHLQPFYSNEDKANTEYQQSPDQIVAAYFNEWAVYGDA